MTRTALNPNLTRRCLPGLLALAISPLLRALLLPLRRRSREDAPVTVFASYMVGDLFMALPALKRIAAAIPVRVLCRADCVSFLEREGIPAAPFTNSFRIRPTVSTFLETWRSAWSLRGHLDGIALDLDADPRTAFWLRIAGVARVVSYRRAYGILFDDAFALPSGAVHQADRDMAVVEEFLRRHVLNGRRATADGRAPSMGDLPGLRRGDGVALTERVYHPPPPSPAWLLSVWTRKPAKNWPLPSWEAFMQRLQEKGVPFAVIDAPDGDAEFRAFRERWNGRVDFARGSLVEIADRVRSSAGVIATDNFLGHMAGYYGKPVLWINVCSPAEQVEPRGPRTVRVQAKDPRQAKELDSETVWRTFEDLRAGAPAAASTSSATRAS